MVAGMRIFQRTSRFESTSVLKLPRLRVIYLTSACDVKTMCFIKCDVRYTAMILLVICRLV
jgi:hypothetical protein